MYVMENGWESVCISPPKLLGASLCFLPCCEGLPGEDIPQTAPAQPPGLCEAMFPLRDIPACHRVGRARELPPGLLGCSWARGVRFLSSLGSPLRAFVGSSDKLVRGTGRRPPPNRLSQKGEENERLEGRVILPAQEDLWERGGGAGPALPALKGSILQDPLSRCPFPRDPKEPDSWTERTLGPRPQNRRVCGEALGSSLPFSSHPSRAV